jgi:amino acid adenylation domain-containing protein
VSGGGGTAWSPVHRLVAAAAERFAELPAVDWGEGHVTYAELAAATRSLWAALAAAGVRPGELVAVLARRSGEVIAAMLAVLEAGAAFVPLDPASPAVRLESAVAEVRPRLWLVAGDQLETAERLDRELGLGARIIVLDRLTAPAAAPPGAAPELTAPPALPELPELPEVIAADPDQLCYLFFTSGSTGRPKAIAGRLQAIDHFVRWEAATFAIGPGVRVSQLTSPAFDAFLRDAFTPLIAGGTVCAPPSREVLADGGKLAAWIESSGVHLVHCTPSLLRLLLSEPLTASRFPALRHVLLAGEVVLPGDVRRWRAAFGDRIELVNLYGPSETTMVKLFHRIGAADAGGAVVPVGRPMPGARAIVMDERRQPCPPGRIGEIYIRTPYCSLGYYQQPLLTREAFVANPLPGREDEVVYRTGDLGRLRDDGAFEVLGRRDQQVKIRGIRVELAPIEELLRSHPEVADATVIDRADAQGSRFLCAYFVPRRPLPWEELAEMLRARLPEVMVPAVAVALAELPRTLGGKLDRRALPDPVLADAADERPPAPPRSGLEERLCGLFAELLGRRVARIDDSFFSLGGHSLLAAQLLARLRRDFGVELSLAELFAAPTVAGLTVALAAARARQWEPAELARRLAGAAAAVETAGAAGQPNLSPAAEEPTDAP